MKDKLIVLTVLAGMCVVYTPEVRAQASGTSQSTANAQTGVDQDIALLRKDIRSGRKQLVAANLKLSDDQATKFCWTGASRG